MIDPGGLALPLGLVQVTNGNETRFMKKLYFLESLAWLSIKILKNGVKFDLKFGIPVN